MSIDNAFGRAPLADRISRCLGAEVQKMERMLLELTMAVDGSKPFGDDSTTVNGKRISEGEP